MHKLLVVDDQPSILEFVSRVITLGYPKAIIHTAATNRKAWRLLKSFTPDLIITDIVRPQGDGYMFLEDLRGTPSTRSIPVIVISGSIRTETDELKCYRIGANYVFSKPFQPHILLKRIGKLIPSHNTKDPDYVLIELKSEAPERDYKERYDLESIKGKASLAKDVIAMANHGGGTIIVGVAEPSLGTFTEVGISQVDIATYENSQINLAIKPFMDPALEVVSRIVKRRSHVFIFIEVPSAITNGIPVLAKKDCSEATLFPGRLYTRTVASESAEIRNSSELREFIEKFTRQYNVKRKNR